MVVPGNYASSAGLDFTRALALEEPPTACQQVVAVRACDEDKPWAQDLKKAFRSPFFRERLQKDFAGYTWPAGL